MLVVGLTGGIGSGKSTVAKRFAVLGTPVIDADQLAHELVRPGQPALQEIVQTFGSQILNSDGSLNRAAMRQRVFADNAERKRLENILHPRIHATMRGFLQNIHESAAYAILVIPLLLESGQTDVCQRILVVDIPETLQIERVKQRNSHSDAEIRAILKVQCSRAQRLAAADDIIDNSGDIAHLITQTDTLHHRYRS